MAPEFLSSLVSLEQHLSNILQNDADESAVVADHAFAALAKSYAWPFEFLRRADCWSLGKYIPGTRRLVSVMDTGYISFNCQIV